MTAVCVGCFNTNIIQLASKGGGLGSTGWEFALG